MQTFSFLRDVEAACREIFTVGQFEVRNVDASAFDGKLGLPNYMRNFSFSSLKAGCLLAGIGLGLLVGFIINMCMATNSYYDDGWYRHEVAGTAYGASVLLFGGIGLIIAFVIELKLGKGNK